MSRRTLWLSMFIMCIIFPLFLGLTLSSPSFAQDPTPTELRLIPLTDPKPPYHELDKYVSTLIGRDAFIEWELQHGNQIISYVDLNGDYMDDMVIHGSIHVVVMLWDGEKYVSPLAIYLRYVDFNESSVVQLDDWTGDDLPEVIFDQRIRSSGTGLLLFTWRRYIITCQELSCHIAWQGDYGSIQTLYDLGGVERTVSRPELTIVNDTPSIVTESRGFSLDGYYTYQYHLIAYPVIRREYLWDGYEFVQSSERLIKEGQGYDAIRKTHAYHPDGHLARIMIEPSNRYFKDPRCILWIDAMTVETQARCKSNFVTVEWRDVTGDGIEEAVFLLTASDREAVSDYLDYDCVHQRLLAFQILDDKYARIADIDGCVSQSDLFGVRIEDVGNDGILEIRSAGDWYSYAEPDSPFRISGWFDFNSQDIVYRFNGVKFIQAETIPRDPR